MYIDVNTRIFLVFEMRLRMNEFDHRILSLLTKQRETPEKFRDPFLEGLKGGGHFDG